MTRETIGNTVVLRADDGAYLTNGTVYSQTVYLGKNADESAWRDATAEEYEAWLAAQEAEAEEPEEPTDAWDVEQGEYIPAGRVITVHGVMYECIRDHSAAWSKQPPNEEYWRAI